jgi:hypothetical protein
MRKKKRNYSEGDLFCVPTERFGWVRGIVARRDAGAFIFGYFLEPPVAIPSAPSEKVTISDAFYCKIFRGDEIHDGSWPIVGKVSDWRRDEWPVPPMLLSGSGSVAFFDDDLVNYRTVSIAEHGTTPMVEGGHAGALFIAARLDMVLGGTWNRYDF